MPFNGFFYLLRLNSDIPLGHSGRTVLEELLNQDDIIPAVPVYLGRVEFPKAVGTDTRYAKILTYKLELLLYSPLRNRENHLFALYPVVQAVAANELIEHQRNSKCPALPCLLFFDVQPVPLSIPQDIPEP